MYGVDNVSKFLRNVAMSATRHRLKTRADQVGQLWHRLPGGRFLRVTIMRALQRLLNPDLIPSYSQFGEDRLIDAFFSGCERGQYVDVGCNRPISYSNTWKLYLRGWRGIVIDANPDLIVEYAVVRPEDIALPIAVSTSKTPVDFYVPHESHLISGIGTRVRGNWPRTVDNARLLRLKPMRLSDILCRYGFERTFELLSIDTEGTELDVLESLDLSEFTPKLIVVEIYDFAISTPEESAIYNFLYGYGYRVVGYVPPSVFFGLDCDDG